MSEVEVYIDSIKEVVAVDGDISWKYVITNTEEEGTCIEYWEEHLTTRKWEKMFDFRVDLFCAKQVFESALKIIEESKNNMNQ